MLMNGARRSGRRSWLDGLVAMGLLGFRQIVRGLKVEPEARIGAEIAAEPDRGIGGDIARAAHDLGQAIGRNAERAGEFSRGEAERHKKFFFQYLAGMCSHARIAISSSGSPRSRRRRGLPRSSESRRATAD